MERRSSRYNPKHLATPLKADVNETAIRILNLSKRIAEQQAPHPHANAVLAQVAVANEIFAGIGTVCDVGNGLAGEALLRTLFEVITTAIILGKHPEKLSDHLDHGRMIELRMLRVIQVPALKKKLEHTIQGTEVEFQGLWKKFNKAAGCSLGRTTSSLSPNHKFDATVDGPPF